MCRFGGTNRRLERLYDARSISRALQFILDARRAQRIAFAVSMSASMFSGTTA